MVKALRKEKETEEKYEKRKSQKKGDQVREKVLIKVAKYSVLAMLWGYSGGCGAIRGMRETCQKMLRSPAPEHVWSFS